MSLSRELQNNQLNGTIPLLGNLPQLTLLCAQNRVLLLFNIDFSHYPLSTDLGFNRCVFSFFSLLFSQGPRIESAYWHHSTSARHPHYAQLIVRSNHLGYSNYL